MVGGKLHKKAAILSLFLYNFGYAAVIFFSKYPIGIERAFIIWPDAGQTRGA
jgi:hypothetical protein